MKNLMKLIVITAVTALLFCMVITCASADERIYTSPTFKLPKDKLNGWLETLPEETAEEEADAEENEEAEETVDPQQEAEPETETEEDSEQGAEETAKPKREVKISSSQGKVVKKNDRITLTSTLVGIDEDEVISYQWQVDRGDGLGWVDVEGATEDKYQYLATAETIRYKWRLIVDVKD